MKKNNYRAQSSKIGYIGLVERKMLQVYKPGELGRTHAGGSVDTDLSGHACGTITVMYYL